MGGSCRKGWTQAKHGLLIEGSIDCKFAHSIQGADSTLWIGFVTAALTPRAIIEKLNGGVNQALQMPDVRNRLEQLGVEIEEGTPEKFDAFIRSEARRLAPLARTGALQID